MIIIADAQIIGSIKTIYLDYIIIIIIEANHVTEKVWHKRLISLPEMQYPVFQELVHPVPSAACEYTTSLKDRKTPISEHFNTLFNNSMRNTTLIFVRNGQILI